MLADLPLSYKYYHPQCTLALRNVWLAALAHAAAPPRVRHAHPYDGPDLHALVGPDRDLVRLDLDALTRDDNPVLLEWLFKRMKRMRIDGEGRLHRPLWSLEIPEESSEAVRIVCEVALRKREVDSCYGSAVRSLIKQWGLV